MRLFCLFRQCRWVWLFNVRNQGEWDGIDINLPDELFGVYQCERCKFLSIGAPRP
jgi:hypothetical protein